MIGRIGKVRVVEYNSGPVAVMGAVHKPVTFQAVGTVTLLDALARAEGLTNDAGIEILLTRNGEGQRVPVKRLLKDADPPVNVALHGGEATCVPDAGKIFVAGNVTEPGSLHVRGPADHPVFKPV